MTVRDVGRNLGDYMNKPTDILRVQNRLHELEEPVSAEWLAHDLGMEIRRCGVALRRLYVKGLADREKSTNLKHRVPKERRIPRPGWRRRPGRNAVYIYTILQER